jgi:hypothetical protein
VLEAEELQSKGKPMANKSIREARAEARDEQARADLEAQGRAVSDPALLDSLLHADTYVRFGPC